MRLLSFEGFLHPFYFPGKLKSFFRGNDCDKFVDDSCGSNCALYDLNLLRRSCQGGADNASKHQRYAGVGQQCQTKIVFDSIWHMHKRCAGSGTEIFSESAGGNVDKRIEAGAEDQVIIQRGSKVKDSGIQSNGENGGKIIIDFFQLFGCDHIRKYSGKGNTHEHIIQCDTGQQVRVYEPADQHGSGDPNNVIQYGHGKQGVCDGTPGMKFIDDGQGRSRCGCKGNTAKKA